MNPGENPQDAIDPNDPKWIREGMTPEQYKEKTGDYPWQRDERINRLRQKLTKKIRQEKEKAAMEQKQAAKKQQQSKPTSNSTRGTDCLSFDQRTKNPVSINGRISNLSKQKHNQMEELSSKDRLSTFGTGNRVDLQMGERKGVEKQTLKNDPETANKRQMQTQKEVKPQAKLSGNQLFKKLYPNTYWDQQEEQKVEKVEKAPSPIRERKLPLGTPTNPNIIDPKLIAPLGNKGQSLTSETHWHQKQNTSSQALKESNLTLVLPNSKPEKQSGSIFDQKPASTGFNLFEKKPQTSNIFANHLPNQTSNQTSSIFANNLPNQTSNLFTNSLPNKSEPPEINKQTNLESRQVAHTPELVNKLEQKSMIEIKASQSRQGVSEPTNEDAAQRPPVTNIFQKPAESNFFGRTPQNNQANQPSGSLFSNKISQPDPILDHSQTQSSRNLFGSKTQPQSQSSSSQQTKPVEIKTAFNIFAQKTSGENLFSQNIFSQPSREGSSIFDNSKPFVNAFSVPEQKSEANDDEGEDNGLEVDEDGNAIHRQQIDPSQSTGNYQYEETERVFRSEALKFKNVQGKDSALIEKVTVSIERLKGDSGCWLIVRSSTKQPIFQAMIVGKTQANLFDTGSVSIDRLIQQFASKQQTPQVAKVRIQFQSAPDAAQLVERVEEISKKCQ